MKITEIYQEIKKTGVEIDSHASDLYVPVTPKTQFIVNNYRFKNNVQTFHDDNNQQWFDIPFAYDPFWQVLPI